MAKRKDHDHAFKNLIIDYSRQALDFFAPSEAPASHDPIRIIPVRQEQLKERLGERFRELDVPLLVEWADGRREALLFVLEEQTDPRRFSIHKLAHYCLDLAELFDTDRVVPVVIFLHEGNYRENLTLGGDRHQFLHFTYLHCPLFRIPWEHYRDSDNLVARLNLPNMRHTPEQRLEVYNHTFRGLMELESDPEKQSKYLDFIDIYTRLSDNELERYRELYPEDVKKMTNFAERFIEQGMQQGKQQGEAAVLLRLMERKFGTLAPETCQRIIEADAETLLTWSERILTAQTPEEVLH